MVLLFIKNVSIDYFKVEAGRVVLYYGLLHWTFRLLCTIGQSMQRLQPEHLTKHTHPAYMNGGSHEHHIQNSGGCIRLMQLLITIIESLQVFKNLTKQGVAVHILMNDGMSLSSNEIIQIINQAIISLLFIIQNRQYHKT